jgi:hypothetical protein
MRGSLLAFGMVLTVAGSGCALFNKAKDAVEGAVDPIVAVGVVTSLAPPTSDLIDLEGTDFEPGVIATLFLADARSVSDLGNAPVAGATIEVTGCGNTVTAAGDAGAYLVGPTDGLGACDGPFDLARVDAEPNRNTAATITLPAAGSVTVPEQWDAGAAMSVDLSSSGYESVIAVVIDVATGAITWTNEPEDIVGYYQLLTGNNPPASLEIPGSAFPDDGVYALVITGIERLKNSNLTNANTVLSVLAGGRATAYPVVTGDLDTDAVAN